MQTLFSNNSAACIFLATRTLLPIMTGRFHVVLCVGSSVLVVLGSSSKFDSTVLWAPKVHWPKGTVRYALLSVGLYAGTSPINKWRRQPIVSNFFHSEAAVYLISAVAVTVSGISCEILGLGGRVATTNAFRFFSF